MSEPASIEEFVLALQKLIREKRDAGISAKVDSDPPVAIQGTEITVQARLFATPSTLAGLKPVLRCNEVADFGDRWFVAGAQGVNFRDYTVALSTWPLPANGTYHLTVYPSPSADALGQCTVHIFPKGIVAAVRRHVLRWRLRRTILKPPSDGATSS